MSDYNAALGAGASLFLRSGMSLDESVKAAKDLLAFDDPGAFQGAKPWRLKLICCGRDDGTETFATREQADAFREAYTSGPSVDPHGYSAAYPNGHQRAAILTHEEADQ